MRESVQHRGDARRIPRGLHQRFGVVLQIPISQASGRQKPQAGHRTDLCEQAIEGILPRYLHRYRVGGRFAERADAA